MLMSVIHRHIPAQRLLLETPDSGERCAAIRREREGIVCKKNENKIRRLPRYEAHDMDFKWRFSNDEVDDVN